MSRIINKAFDASKKIVRSIFRGSPNLLTSSDLNRQIEALKYQIDKLEERTNVDTDLDINVVSVSSHNYNLENPEGNVKVSENRVTFTLGYMRFKGCLFTPTVSPTTIFIGENEQKKMYIHLVAEKKIVTYEDDFSHEISGAKFEDGTSMPAADNEVYFNEKIVCTENKNEPNSLVILAEFTAKDWFPNNDEPTPVFVKKYYTESPNMLTYDKEAYSPFIFQAMGNNGKNCCSKDYAISALFNDIKKVGKSIISGECKFEGSNSPCGYWAANIVGNTLTCCVSILYSLNNFLSKEGTFVKLSGGITNIAFLQHAVPVDKAIKLSIGKGRENIKGLYSDDFGKAIFYPSRVASNNPLIRTSPFGINDSIYLGGVKENVEGSTIFGTTGGSPLTSSNYVTFTFSTIIEV